VKTEQDGVLQALEIAIEMEADGKECYGDIFLEI